MRCGSRGRWVSARSGKASSGVAVVVCWDKVRSGVFWRTRHERHGKEWLANDRPGLAAMEWQGLAESGSERHNETWLGGLGVLWLASARNGRAM